jgi:hypothetical protein
MIVVILRWKAAGAPFIPKRMSSFEHLVKYFESRMDDERKIMMIWR